MLHCRQKRQRLYQLSVYLRFPWWTWSFLASLLTSYYWSKCDRYLNRQSSFRMTLIVKLIIENVSYHPCKQKMLFYHWIHGHHGKLLSGLVRWSNRNKFKSNWFRDIFNQWHLVRFLTLTSISRKPPSMTSYVSKSFVPDVNFS